MGPGDAMGRRLDRTPWSYEQPVSDATAGDGTPCTTGSPSLTAKTQNGSPFVISSPSAYQAPRAVGSFGQVLTAHERKGRHGCTAIRLLVFLLFFFVCLSCVTIAIILWMGEPCARGQHEEQPTASETVKDALRVPQGCYVAEQQEIPAQTLLVGLKPELNSYREFIKSHVADGKAGAVISNIVYGDDVIWTGSFGTVDKMAKTPQKPDASTVFPCASVSKIFTALLMFRLYSTGSVSTLNKPITDYEPRLSISNPFNDDPITLRELAAHRSGLPREAPCYPVKDNNMCPYDYDAMLARVNNLKLLRKPGAEPQYSNLGIALLGQVLAHYFGAGGFAEFMKQVVLDPLGLTSTTFTLTDSLRKEIPVVYLGDEDKDQIYDWGWLDPTGGVYTSVEDLAKIETALFSERNVNRFLSKGVTQEFFAPDYIFPSGKTMVGIPWEMRLQDGNLVLEKAGSVYGYESLISLVPERKFAMNFICTDCNPMMPKLRRKFDQLAAKVANLSRTSEPTGVIAATLPSDPSPYIGKYQPDNIPTIPFLEVEVVGGKLWLMMGSAPFLVLHQETSSTFRLTVDENKSCFQNFAFGLRNELVIFEEAPIGEQLSPGFTMFSAHPSGKTFFKRIDKP